jgi:hypothetical protein
MLKRNGQIQELERLPKAHQEFDEQYIQELLVEHTELLPVSSLRDNVGKLICIGREVQLDGIGFIDNLYLSTGGYPVIIETKLWRNPQARREVLSQVLDYTKELVNKDFEWFEQVWVEFSKGRYGNQESLIEKLDEFAEDEIEESLFIDRLNRALRRGDILAFIVGDGIETRLQQLVSHICKDSAHLRYSLALIELACYRINDQQSDNHLLFVPRIIQEVDPVERAYVRIEVASELNGHIQVKSLVSTEQKSSSGYVRTILNEEEFLNALDTSVGNSVREKIEQFYRNLSEELELELDFKSATMSIKIPDPAGEKPGVSVLAIERQGRIYNTKHMPGQLERWGVPKDLVSSITTDFWLRLHKIDHRFLKDGIKHMSLRQFIPIIDLVDKLDQIDKEVRRVVTKTRQSIDQ